MLDTKLQTSLLTVWRTLNVECDSFEYYFNEAYDFANPQLCPKKPNDRTTPPSPAGYLNDFVVNQLRRACVEIDTYDYNEHIYPSFPTYNPMTGSDGLAATSSMQDPGNPSRAIPNPDFPIEDSGRDLDFGWNNPDFWTIRILTISSVSKDSNSPGSYLPYGVNTILVHYATTQKMLKEWDPNYTNTHLITSIRRTILHEFAHALIETDEGSGGVRQTDLGLTDRMNPDYQIFLKQHIMEIQKNSKVIG